MSAACTVVLHTPRPPGAPPTGLLLLPTNSAEWIQQNWGTAILTECQLLGGRLGGPVYSV